MSVPRRLLSLVVAFATTGLAMAGLCGGPDNPTERAFPGAMGPGTQTPGGRYGRVLVVDTLDDIAGSDLPGQRSFRWAWTQTFPRFIVFKVGGVIRLTKPLSSKSGCVTVAGHSAPPPGITLVGDTLYASSMNDAVLRYFRSRKGDAGCTRATYLGGAGANNARGCTCTDADSITINGNGLNRRIVVDHVSAAFGTDETLSVTGVLEYTVSNCLVTQALHNACHEEDGEVERHGMGTLLGTRSDGAVAWYRNLYTQINTRVPRLSTLGATPTTTWTPPTFTLANNVIADGRSYGSDTGFPIQINMLYNVKEYSQTTSLNGQEAANLEPTPDAQLYAGVPVVNQLYLEGNVNKKGPWPLVLLPTSQAALLNGGGTQVKQPFSFSSSASGWPLSVSQDVRAVYNSVVKGAGVWQLRDWVDDAAITLLLASKYAPVDSPGGCCVAVGCNNAVQVAMATQDVVKNCSLAPCGPGYYQGSEQCGVNAKTGLNEATIQRLNSKLRKLLGINWADTAKWPTAASIETYLEKCAFPDTTGACAGLPPSGLPNDNSGGQAGVDVGGAAAPAPGAAVLGLVAVMVLQALTK